MPRVYQRVFAAVVLSLGLGSGAPAAEEKILNIYNWSDYIAADTIAGFEKETGIRVTYDVFDSNEVLEAKLLAGNTGFDIVVPSLSFLARQIQAGVFMTLDKSRLSNYGNLDPVLLKRIAALDADNAHAIPYLWGTTGIGYNVARVKAVLGDDAPVDSWSLILDPKNLAKLKACGVAFLDAPIEVIPAVLNYLGEDPNSFDTKLIQGKAQDLLMQLRPYITYFHSSQYINDLANGDICVALGWSGDILQAADRASEANNGVEVAYSIPREGAAMWFDMMAIPKDARHPQNALLFMNYILRPEVIAAISNYVWYANGNSASTALVDREILDDPGIYPRQDVVDKLYTFKVLPASVDRAYTRTWTRVKTGR
jgi:putrescine transport system substrate-binding protein